MSSIHQMKKEINNVRHNPAAIQRYTLDTLKEIHQGNIDIVDATNPFIFLMMSSAVHASASMTESANLTRQQYPSLAITEEELYLHMSDHDFLGRFATPARTHFSLLFHQEELIRRAVQVPDSNIRKLVIPRHSEFIVSDYVFTLQYPIELRVMAHGGIQVAYDVSQSSPLQVLESNVLEWRTISLNRENYLRIEVPVNQMTLVSHMVQLNKATAYKKTFTLTDDFYYCRVWRSRSGEWREINTTHTDQVFDPFNPTVLLRVFDNKLEVSVPHVYVSQGILEGELRLDIYTTKGPLDLILDSYPANAFRARWRDVEQSELDRYSSPLTVFGGMTLFSDAIVTGGNKALDFDTLREKVLINAIGPTQLPITSVQMTNQLTERGYTPILDIDNVTQRIYLASRQLPNPPQSLSHSAIGSRFGRLQSSFSDLVRYKGVVNNGDRVTITPEALFQEVDGILQLVNDQSRSELMSLTGEMFTSTVNNGRYYYTPFHYVLDASQRYFESRPYQLNQPRIRYRQFVQENDTLEMTLSTQNVSVEKNDAGYRLRVVTLSGDTVKEMPDDDIIVQLFTRPREQNQDVYMLGRQVGKTTDGERVYEFDIKTQWDIDENNGLIVTNFSAIDGEQRRSSIPLMAELNILYHVIPGEGIIEPREVIRNDGGQFQIPPTFFTLTHEQIGVEMGRFLEGFWNNSRSVLDNIVYDRYSEDIYAYYEETVYKRDPTTGLVDIRLDSDGNIEYQILHRQGDPVLDVNGEHAIRHKKGEVKLDQNGDPIVLSDREVLREIDIFLFDGRYYFVDHPATQQYITDTTRRIESWLTDDIVQFRQWALEQTDIFFYPRQTMGTTNARILENEQYAIELEQSFRVTFYLDSERYRDSYIRSVLTDLTQEVIAEHLTHKRVSINTIISELTRRSGEDAIALTIEGLGGDKNLTTVTLENDSDRCSIRKRLIRTLDGLFAVENDINVLFLRHEDY